MQRKSIFSILFAVGILLVMGAGIWLATAVPASAQCGSQASSCKNCHEVQGQLPVNNDGNGWHTSHAFGDFCYICHAGNNQAQDQAEAHMGMVAPLSDVQAACMQCHPNDYEALAQDYATVLGVEVGNSASDPVGDSTTSQVEVTSAATSVGIPAANELVVDDPNLVDYVRRYDEIVLGKKPVNWGNVILLGMIGVVAIGGGGFVVTREKLLKVSFGDTRPVSDEYPGDVVDLLPGITSLKPSSRKALKSILSNPKKADKLLGLMNAVISDQNEDEL